MAPPRGSAAYKKQDGTLELSKDSKSVTWTPVAPPGSKPALTLPVSGITNLQQTPLSNPKVMLKVFHQPSGSKTTDTHTFQFTNAPTARVEADAIKEALSRALQASKAGDAAPAAGGGSSSASLAIASAVSSKSTNDASVIYDDDKLVQDKDLQMSLLSTDRGLQRTLAESRKTRPDSLSLNQFQTQFWSTRIHLLRAHAIEKRQTRGSYNVLATIKPITVEGVTKLSISKEQIQLLFSQHPLVQRAYDENVPKITEENFWSRFFQSRLSKRLRGERIGDSDPVDNVLDKYLLIDEDTERGRRLMSAHVPHIINIEGNEQNHPQRKGNDGDMTMRARTLNKAPIIRTLNALSEKILSQVTPNDINPSLPIGVDEETYNELRLRDLQGDAEEHRNILNINNQSRFFSHDESGLSADALLYAEANPQKVLESLLSDLSKASPFSDLSTAIGGDEDSDSDDQGDDHVGSTSARSAATAQMLAAIAQQRLQSDDSTFSTVASTVTSGLSQTVFDRLTLTHATTTEFLSHFWSAFLSGKESRADEIGRLVETLDRAMDRIKAVAEDAEKERKGEQEKLRRQVAEYEQRTGRRRRVDMEGVPGGKKAVDELMKPTVRAIERAGDEYRRALEEQVKEDGV